VCWGFSYSRDRSTHLQEKSREEEHFGGEIRTLTLLLGTLQKKNITPGSALGL
jgi:hypothetical protein